METPEIQFGKDPTPSESVGAEQWNRQSWMRDIRAVLALAPELDFE